MTNTYTQLHVQIVIVVSNRQSLIQNAWKTELYKYITGIIQNYGHKVLAINWPQDHVHILIGLRPSQSLSELMKQVKQYSSRWINENRLTLLKFSWQAGYGAFSYSKSAIPKVLCYIQNQEDHHKEKSFSEEFRSMLIEFGLDYEERFIFKDV